MNPPKSMGFHPYICGVLLGIFFMTVDGCYAGIDNASLASALQNVRNSCSGISDSMHDLKVKAGINTSVTAVGTVAGGVAVGAGVAKARTDKEYYNLSQEIIDMAASRVDQDILEIKDESQIQHYVEDLLKTIPEPDYKKINELEKKSKTLGNVRTGTLAVSTVTNVAGTAIAATNKVDDNLEDKINKCIAAVKDLSNAKTAAKVENTASDTEIAQAERIINACRDYEYVDLKPINKRATGAAISSGVGVGTGLVGTITSAVANSDNTRQGDIQKEHSLNTTANMMAGASTVASATATVFNATQISAIKKVANVADVCEEALR